MYPAVIKRQLLKPSVANLNFLARASVHNKAHTDTKGNEDFYVSTTFPDDFEASPLNPEMLQKHAEAEASTGPWDKATTEQHKKDIYESIYPGQSSGKKKQKEAPPDPERAPEIDEM